LHNHPFAFASKTETMPSVSSCLTWALEVDAIEACARFEAYINTKDVMLTLEMCNRFGRGSKAYITRVQAEVIQSIGGFLTEMERKEELDECYQEQACWSSTCESMDHFDSKNIEHMYFAHLDDGCNCEKKADFSASGKNSGCGAFVERVEVAENDCAIHNTRSDAWEQRLGCSTSGNHGIFDRAKGFLQRDFGLRVWTSHIQRDHEDAQTSLEHGLDPKTAVWLILPNSRIITRKYKEREPYWVASGGSQYTPTESGYQCSIILPEKPSEKSLQRWPRALRILGLEGIASDLPELYASKVDRDAADMKDSEATRTLNGSDQMAGADVYGQPTLRLLVSCRSEPCDR